MTQGSSNLTTGRTNDLDQFNLPSSQRISARDSMDLPCPVSKVSISHHGGHGKFGGIPTQANKSNGTKIKRSRGQKGGLSGQNTAGNSSFDCRNGSTQR